MSLLKTWYLYDIISIEFYCTEVKNMFESKYSKILTVILVIVIIAILGLIGFLGYDYYKKYQIFWIKKET